MPQNIATPPVLTPEERATLLSHEPALRVAEDTLNKLESMGADVSAERDMLDRTKALRAGLLQHFGATTTAPVSPRGRRNSG